MKKFALMFALALFIVAFVAGCAKKPEQEISASKSAIDSVVADGGEKYAKEETKALQSAMGAAMSEVDAQEKKFFKNFDEAKKQLAKVATDAAAIKASIPGRKEKAKSDAVAALTTATTSLTAAKELLTKAPTGKDAKADIEALKADVAGLEAEAAAAQELINKEEFFQAADKANAINTKATEVSNQINAAIEKFGKKGKKGAKAAAPKAAKADAAPKAKKSK